MRASCLGEIRRGVRVVEGARLESVYTLTAYRGFESLSLRHILFNGTRIGSLATIDREPRQARKGATVAVDSGAGV